MVLNNLLNPVLSPLLVLGPTWAVIVISLLIALLITFSYKWMTDQEMMKRLKGEVKEMNQQMKKLKDQPEKMMAVQKDMMAKNMTLMKHSFKPTLITLLPLLLIYGWLYGHLGFHPLLPGQPFLMDAHFSEDATGNVILLESPGLEYLSPASQPVAEKVKWEIQGEAGSYVAELEYKGKSYQKEILITEKQEYAEPVLQVKGNGLEQIEIHMEKLIILNLFGWRLGWLGSYILLSIVFSTVLRKVLRVY